MALLSYKGYTALEGGGYDEADDPSQPTATDPYANGDAYSTGTGQAQQDAWQQSAPTAAVAPISAPTPVYEEPYQPVYDDPYSSGDAYSTGTGQAQADAWAAPASAPAEPYQPTSTSSYQTGDAYSTGTGLSQQAQWLGSNPDRAWATETPSQPAAAPPTNPDVSNSDEHIHHSGQDHWYPERREKPEALPFFTPPSRFPQGTTEPMVTYRDGTREPASVYLSRSDQDRYPLLGEPDQRPDGMLPAAAFQPWLIERRNPVDWPATYTPEDDLSGVEWGTSYNGRESLISGRR